MRLSFHHLSRELRYHVLLQFSYLFELVTAMHCLLLMMQERFHHHVSGSAFCCRRLEKDLAAAHTMLMHQRSSAAHEIHLMTQQSQGPSSCAACIKMSVKFVLVSAMRSFRSLQLLIGTKPKRVHDEHIV